MNSRLENSENSRNELEIREHRELEKESVVTNKVVDFINLHRDRYVEELKEYLAIPSISALPQHAADVKRCAEWTAGELGKVGLNNVRLIETPGNPVVYGEWLGAAGAPTLLFYGHYDVQPVDPLDKWTSPPFEATVRDGEIYARGSADDKGQIFMHFKAIEAWIKEAGGLPVNIKVFIEGEEEVGSTHLDAFVRDNRDLLKADVVVISDSPMFDRGIPSICGNRRRSRRPSAMVRSTPAARPTTRARSSCTSRPSRRT